MQDTNQAESPFVNPSLAEKGSFVDKPYETPNVDPINEANSSKNLDNQPEIPQSQQLSDDQAYQEYFPGIEKPIQEELVFQWQAPSRPFKKRNRQYFTTIATIVLLLCLILFFAGQLLPVAVVIAVAFLSYIMATIPPHTITNSLTTFGIHNENDFYFWEELGRFWFDKKYNDEILQIEVNRFPYRLTLLLGNEKQETFAEILSEVLINERPPLTETERLSNWLQKKVPLDFD